MEQDHIGTVREEQFEHIEILPFYENGKLLRLYSANKRLVDEKDISFLQTKDEEKVIKSLEKAEKQSACDDSQENCGSNFWLDNAVYLFLLIGATILWLLFLKR